MRLEFFDCNCYVGLPTNPPPRPVRTAGELLKEMDRAGVAKALVWHAVQRDASVQEGNRLIAEAIRGQEKRLCGCWSILPTQTGELPAPDRLFGMMKEHNIRALRAFPSSHNYLLRKESVGKILAPMCRRKVPLVLAGVDWPTIYALMADFPKLTCIVCETGLWGPDRWFRPLVEKHRGFHVEISQYFLAGGIADFVEWRGARQMVFGSSFPDQDYGGMMLTLRHAEIGEKDRQAIAGGNVERILAEGRL